MHISHNMFEISRMFVLSVCTKKNFKKSERVQESKVPTFFFNSNFLGWHAMIAYYRRSCCNVRYYACAEGLFLD